MTSFSMQGLKGLAAVVPATVTPREFVAIVEWAQRELVVKADVTVLHPPPSPGRAAQGIQSYLIHARVEGEPDRLSIPAAPAAPQPVSGMCEPPAADANERGQAPAESAPTEPPSPPAAPLPPELPRKTPPPFTEVEVQTIFDERAKGTSFDEIGAMLGRSAGGCQTKFYTERKKTRNNVARQRAVAKLAPAPSQQRPTANAPAAVAARSTAVASAPFPGCAPRVAAIIAALTHLDDSFAPADDLVLIDGRHHGHDWDRIADQLGCAPDDAKARWRLILGCKLAHKGGIITPQGWSDLQQAARFVVDRA